MDAQSDTPVWLFELVPLDLTGRNFASVKSVKQIEPGYRAAPSVDKDIAIVFVKVEKPLVLHRDPCALH